MAWWLAALLVAAVLGSCQGRGTDDPGRKSPEIRQAEQLARQSWPRWVSTHLGVGAGGLVVADGRLLPNDWGVADSFEWELTFRDDLPATRTALIRAVHRACEFGPAQALTSHRVTAHFTTRGIRALVPTLFMTDCRDGFDRLGPWLGYVERHALPPEVRGSGLFVGLNEDDSVTLYVSSSDASAAVADRIARHYCGAPGRSRLSMTIRSSDRPWAVDDQSLASLPVPTPRCSSTR